MHDLLEAVARTPVNLHDPLEPTEAQTPKPIPFFRRGDMEALLGLKRRQAINLMHRIGAVRVSHEIAVPQRDLVSWLEKMVANPARAREIRRQERVIGRIVEWKTETAAAPSKSSSRTEPRPETYPPGSRCTLACGPFLSTASSNS